MSTEPAEAELRQMRTGAHSHCVVCSRSNERGMGLEFVACDGGGVQARFDCSSAFEGYPGMVHGGVVASLLDGAMTNCMFAHGYVAVTAEIRVRFQQPVAIGVPVTIRARITRSMNPLHVVTAELVQDQKIKASAEAKFMEHPSLEFGLEGMDPNDH